MVGIIFVWIAILYSEINLIFPTFYQSDNAKNGGRKSVKIF